MPSVSMNERPTMAQLAQGSARTCVNCGGSDLMLLSSKMREEKVLNRYRCRSCGSVDTKALEEVRRAAPVKSSAEAPKEGAKRGRPPKASRGEQQPAAPRPAADDDAPEGVVLSDEDDADGDE